MTATLPVVPGSDQSSVPPFCGAVVGHAPTGVGVSVAEDPTISATEGVPADDVSASEPHAASVITNDAAQPTSATEEDTREFTVVTLEPRYVRGCLKTVRFGRVAWSWRDHGEVDDGFVVVGSGLVVARAAAVLVDPRETSLDHPTAGPDVETSGAGGCV